MPEVNDRLRVVGRHLRNAAVDGIIGVLAAEAWLFYAVSRAMQVDSAAGMGIFAAPLVAIPGAGVGVVVGLVVRTARRLWSRRRPS